MKMLKAMKLRHRQIKMEAYTTNFNIYQFEDKIVAKVHVKTKPKSVARYKKSLLQNKDITFKVQSFTMCG